MSSNRITVMDMWAVLETFGVFTPVRHRNKNINIWNNIIVEYV